MSSDHFSPIANSYARHRPDYPPSLFADLARLAPARRVAWDCATGSGQAARGLAAHFRTVYASDASAAQIAVARAPANVTFAVAAAERCALAMGCADLVTVAQALHWFERGSFYREVRRVLAPDGVLAVWCYQLLNVSPAVDAIVEHLYGQVLAPFWPPQRRHVEAGYQDLEFPFKQLGFGQYELAASWTLNELLGYLSTWSALQACRVQTGADPLPAIRRQLARVWGPGERRRSIRWPLCVRVGRPA